MHLCRGKCYRGGLPTSDITKLKALTKDITDDYSPSGSRNLYSTLKGNANTIKAWESLSDLPQSFRTIDNIKAVDAFETLKNGSLSSIKSKLSTLPGDAHQAFLNGIKHVGDNGILSSSLTLNRIPSVQEIADATLRIKQYRVANGIPTDKNFGHLGGNLSGGSVTNVSDEIISSGPAVPVGQRVFDAIEVGGWE